MVNSTSGFTTLQPVALKAGAQMLGACQSLASSVAGDTAGDSTPPVALTEYNVYNAA
jgi:hypothetical protein